MGKRRRKGGTTASDSPAQSEAPLRSHLLDPQPLPAEIQITQELNSKLGCNGIVLESGFLVSGPHRDTRVGRKSGLAAGLVGQPGAGEGGEVLGVPVRHFPSRQAEALNRPLLPRAGGLREAAFETKFEARQKRDIRQVFKEAGSAAPASSISSLSGQVTYSTDDFWIFCTSVMPRSGLELERMRQRFSYECATTITEPSKFARQLGRTFAENLAEDDVSLNFQAHMKTAGRDALGIRRRDCVGESRPRALRRQRRKRPVFSLPHHLQGIAAPFVKRRSYEWQNEYRFTVSTTGTPATDELYLPIPDEMRSLAVIEPS